MDQPGSRPFHRSPCDAERERIQELSRYYCTLDQFSASPDGAQCVENTRSKPDSLKRDEQPSSGVLSSDITLTALAQLGVHRFGCNRSFISLIDGDNQHLIAEATASVSLRDKDRHLPNDDIYLGVRTIDLTWGVCPHAIRLFTGQDLSHAVDTQNMTANSSRCIIRDFTKEDLFKDRPYVREWPHMRFYAEVPLYSASGHVLGSFCVIDNKPRASFDDEEVESLQEIADAVAKHLENVRVVHCHRRAERLVRGLTNFVKECSDFDPQEFSSSRQLESTAQSYNELDRANVADTFPPPPSGITEQASAVFSPGPASRSTGPSSFDSDCAGQPSTPDEENALEAILKPRKSERTKALSNNDSQVSLAESISISDQTTSIFSRASVLLRDSMDLDGVIFLDAARGNQSFQPSHEEASWEPLPKSATPELPLAPCPSPLGLSNSTSNNEALCDVLSFAMKDTSLDSSDVNCPINITAELLSLLIARFPQGQTFTLDTSTDNDDYVSFGNDNGTSPNQAKSIQRISRQIMQLLPGAQSVLVSPLWDYNKSRWMAVTLVWTRDTHRALGMEELHYFKVFGDSIVSEVSRVHWMATEKSKFNFISSVSHELRSPLHGILASAELLHTTALQPTQEELVKMIETSGLTLLDTTDHLLEFCKINSLTHAKKSRGGRSRPDASSLVSDFDLGILVEEVTNILYTGQKALTTAGQSGTSTSPSNIGPSTQSKTSPATSLVVRIEQSQPWQVRSLPGAWRRIVMNLLGNAIKWTKFGFIEASLSHARDQSDPQSHLAHLTVTDTGSGIASDFLRHKLFTPFSQEDPLAEGVGLGLSIVHQLVASLNGHVNIRSESGIGTQVDVYIPVQHLETAKSKSADVSEPCNPREHTPAPLHACMVAFNGYPDLKEAPTGMLTVEAKRKLSIQSTLADIFMSRFGWSVSLAKSLDKAKGDLAVVEESTLATVGEENSRQMDGGPKLFLVLGNEPPGEGLPRNAVWMPQPFGPQKIQAAVQKIYDLRGGRLESECLASEIPATSNAQQTPDSVSSPPLISDEDNATVQVSSDTMRPNSPSIFISHEQAMESSMAHVLIVDDNEINLKIMATFMHKIGCTYDTASNGLIALEKYISSSITHQYDFVLMDISMPIMDGLVSASRIRQYEAENNLKAACIMAVTGVASESMMQQALAAGINDYLIKPLSLSGLKKLMSIA